MRPLNTSRRVSKASVFENQTIQINMTNWTEERRQRQRELIRQWRPWEKSTGPKTAEGKLAVGQNAYKGALWLKLRRLNGTTTQLIKQMKAAGMWPPRLDVPTFNP